MLFWEILGYNPPCSSQIALLPHIDQISDQMGAELRLHEMLDDRPPHTIRLLLGPGEVGEVIIYPEPLLPELTRRLESCTRFASAETSVTLTGRGLLQCGLPNLWAWTTAEGENAGAASCDCCPTESARLEESG